MGLLNNDQDTRIQDIEAAHANGELSSEQRAELLGIEGSTTNYLRLKYAGLLALCLTIAAVSF